MLYAECFAEIGAIPTDTLTLAFEARCRRRQCLNLPGGEEFGYSLPSGTSLQDGDKLLATDGASRRVIVIVAAMEALVEVRARDGLQFARAAYHLGNRHVAIEMGSDAHGNYLRMQPDHVLEAMLLRLGCSVHAVQASFQPEGGAYEGNDHAHHGADHSHGLDTPLPHGHGEGPKIHEFR